MRKRVSGQDGARCRNTPATSQRPAEGGKGHFTRNTTTTNQRAQNKLLAKQSTLRNSQNAGQKSDASQPAPQGHPQSIHANTHKYPRSMLVTPDLFFPYKCIYICLLWCNMHYSTIQVHCFQPLEYQRPIQRQTRSTSPPRFFSGPFLLHLSLRQLFFLTVHEPTTDRSDAWLTPTQPDVQTTSIPRPIMPRPRRTTHRL